MKYVIHSALEAAEKHLATKLDVDDLKFGPSNPKFGSDYAIVCFGPAKEKGLNPNELARKVASYLRDDKSFDKVEYVGGFVNVWISDQLISKALDQIVALGSKFGAHDTYAGQTVLVEHTDPNPFKEFHIGHVYSNTVGTAVGRIFELAGARVHQVSYHGDTGMHIAMAIWGIKKSKLPLEKIKLEKRAEFLGRVYAIGATHFKEDEKVRQEIRALNKIIYQKTDPKINKIYETGRDWSLEYFNEIYERLGVEFEKSYFESEVADIGLRKVKENLGSVFELSENAIVFKGDEKKGLHTRVFVNGDGVPVYEAKEVGLIFSKQKDYPKMDKSVVITGNEIDAYFKVVIEAISRIDPKLGAKMQHISHGMVRLKSGKMSSRTGDVIRGVDLLDEIETTIKEAHDSKAKVADIALGALKYAFLKSRVGGDTIFDFKDSISLDGNSGPYIQYAYARANSIVAKSAAKPVRVEALSTDERSLLLKITEFADVSKEVIRDLSIHDICTYLYALTQEFNRFYEKNRVIGDEREALRVQIIKSYLQTIRNCLNILNIPVVEKI